MGEVMGFFEELRERTIRKLLIQDGYDPIEDADMFEPPPDGWMFEVDEVDATIEALKEIMVGKPGIGSLKHTTHPDGSPNTLVFSKLTEETCLTGVMEGHHGTDGEEVYVIVVRGGEKLLVPEEAPLDEEE